MDADPIVYPRKLAFGIVVSRADVQPVFAETVHRVQGILIPGAVYGFGICEARSVFDER